MFKTSTSQNGFPKTEILLKIKFKLHAKLFENLRIFHRALKYKYSYPQFTYFNIKGATLKFHLPHLLRYGEAFH